MDISTPPARSPKAAPRRGLNAAMARDGDTRLASLSLFAAQSDFTAADELRLFITEDQLDFLDDIMRAQGLLSSRADSAGTRLASCAPGVPTARGGAPA